jgi:hypothetical protein
MGKLRVFRLRSMVFRLIIGPLCVNIGAIVGGIANSGAMEFRTFLQSELKEVVIIGEGPIADGDAERFAKIAPLATRDKYGNVTLVLNSPGGSVHAAFKLVEAMDEFEVSTIVPDNATCASACASIVYISGRYHDVLGTGILGFHTCYINNSGIKEPSALCNEAIAEHAFTRGTSYAAVDFASKDYGPDGMAWIGRGVACAIGLCGPPTVTQTLAIPTFLCSGTLSAVKREICGDRRLARYDREIETLYKTQTSRLGPNRSEIAGHSSYRATRDRCAGTSISTCLLTVKRKRLAELWQASVAR